MPIYAPFWEVLATALPVIQLINKSKKSRKIACSDKEFLSKSYVLTTAAPPGEHHAADPSTGASGDQD